jgi:Ca2+-binding RTX toxin-like protein
MWRLDCKESHDWGYTMIEKPVRSKQRLAAAAGVAAAALAVTFGGGASAHHLGPERPCQHPTIPSNGNEGGVVFGTNGPDVYKADSGQPTTFYGRRGGDVFCGNKGQDTFYGGRGSDEGHGGHGSDTLRGGPGASDLMNGESSGGDFCVAEREVNCEK